MRKPVLLLFFMTLIMNCEAQWALTACPDVSWGSGHYGQLGAVRYISETEAVYYSWYYFSPSSGSSERESYTSDGFITSTIYSQSFGTGYYFYGFYSVPNQRIFFSLGAGGPYHYVVRYKNGLDSISFYQYDGNFIDFAAPDSAVNYLLYQRYLNSQYSIEKYDHGNVNVEVCTFPAYLPRKIVFPTIDTGYILATVPGGGNWGGDIILKSNNGGVSWTEVYNDSTIKLYGLYFVTPDIGYAAGDSGLVVKTTDGGQTWQRLQTGVTFQLGEVVFPEENIGFICTGSKMINTFDGGITWNLDTSFSTYSGLKNLHFVNDSIGFVQNSYCVYKINTGDLKKKWGSNETLQIFPNPSIRGNIAILVPEEMKFEEHLTLEAYSSDGKLVMKRRIDITYNTINFTNESLSPGIYFLRLTNGIQTYTGKLLVER